MREGRNEEREGEREEQMRKGKDWKVGEEMGRWEREGGCEGRMRRGEE